MFGVNCLVYNKTEWSSLQSVIQIRLTVELEFGFVTHNPLRLQRNSGENNHEKFNFLVNKTRICFQFLPEILTLGQSKRRDLNKVEKRAK